MGSASVRRKGAQTKNAAKPPRRSEVYLRFMRRDCQYARRMGTDSGQFQLTARLSVRLAVLVGRLRLQRLKDPFGPHLKSYGHRLV